MYVLLISLFMVVSAHADEFSKELSRRWADIREVRANQMLVRGRSISEPKGADIQIMEVYLNGANFKPIKDCVLFRIPSEKEAGLIYLHQVQTSQSCEEYILNTETFKKEEVYNFGFNLDKRELVLLVDSQKLNFKIKDNKNFMVSTSKLNSNLELKNGDFCYRIDDKCDVIQKNNCDACPKSVLNIVENNCFNDYSKVCSDKSCGEKDQPACIRGRASTDYKLNYCIPDSPIAFCREGLRVFCEEDRLICK